MATVFSKYLRNTNQKIPRKNFRKSHETSASSIKPFSSYAKNTSWGAQSHPPPARSDRVKYKNVDIL